MSGDHAGERPRGGAEATQLGVELDELESRVLLVVNRLPYPPVTIAAQSYIAHEVSRMFADLRKWAAGGDDDELGALGVAYIMGKALRRE